MKHFSALILLSLFLFGFTANKTSSLVGKWRGEDGKEVGFIVFDKKGYVSFSIRDQVIGGKNYLSDGVVYDMTYEADDQVLPMRLDFVIITHEDKTEIARMPGIYKLTNDETLVINMKFDGSSRPTTFDEESDDQITLTKIK